MAAHGLNESNEDIFGDVAWSNQPSARRMSLLYFIHLFIQIGHKISTSVQSMLLTLKSKFDLPSLTSVMK